MSSTQSAADYASSYEQTRRIEREEFHVGQDAIDYFREYAREKPEVVAMWCFGIGFILGWKLKPW